MTGPMLAQQDMTANNPVPTDPDKPWHMQKTPEEWQAINRKAMEDFHASMAADPTKPNRDALEAIKDSNDALNEYDKPAINAGSHVLPTGYGDPFEAVKGEASGAMGAVTAPFHLANTALNKGTDAAIDEVIKGITSIPGEITSGDPRRIGAVAGGTATGIAMGRLGTKLAKGTGSAISNLAERPALKNALLRAQTEAAHNTVTKGSGLMGDLFEQSGLKTEGMKQNISVKNEASHRAGAAANRAAELHPDALDQAGLKTTKLDQDVQRGAGSLGATTERPGLQNELTRLQIERLQRLLDNMDDEGDAGPSGSAPVEPTPSGGAPNDILANPKTPEQLRREANQQDFTDNADPYDLKNMVKPTAPDDLLGNIINELKSKQVEGDAPHDVLRNNLKDQAKSDMLGAHDALDKTSRPGPRPLTPEQINQLLRDIGGGNMSK